MNRIYRTLWSVVTQSWQAVPETAKTAGKKSKSSAGGVVVSVALGFTLNGVAHAQAPPSPPAINQLPTGGTVARGAATISQTATAQAAAMVVNQSSQRAVINWSTFNLGSAASINFVQPNAQAVTLNRVNDSNPSQIFGRINANGQVFLTNANGVYFSPTSSVDVGAITATTHSITDDNFMSGKYVFERNGATGKVVNEGNITAALGGYVALLAPEVQNAGVVVARAGTVAMAAGEVITLTVDGAGSLAGMTTTASAIAALVENKLAVLAPDGQIILSAVALDKLQAGVVKNSGSLEANSLVNKGGKIVLEGDHIVMDRNSKIEAKGRTGGGTVLVGGDWQGSGDMRQATQVTMEQGASIDANATDNGDGGKVVLWSDVSNALGVTLANGTLLAEAGPHGGHGGQIETSGHVLNVDGLQVSTQAKQGMSGKWLLDPYNITISTAAQTAGLTLSGGVYTTNTASSTLNTTTLQTALNNGNVEVSTSGVGAQTGDISISNAISWSSANTLKLTAAGGIAGAGNITMGAGGGLIFNQTGTSALTNIYSGIISGDGSFTKDGPGIAILTGASNYTGSTTITAGTLQIGNGGASATTTMGTGVVVNNATLAFNGATGQAFAPNTISGTGAITVSGATAGSGSLTLRADNTFSGGITLNSGPRVVAGGSSAGVAGALTAGPFGTGTVTLAQYALLDLAGYNIGNTLKSTYNASTTSVAPTVSLSSGVSVLSGQIDVSASGSGLVLAPAAGSTIRLTGTLNANATDTYNIPKLKLSGAGNVAEAFSSLNNKYMIYLETTAGQWTLASDVGNSIGLGTKANLFLYGGTFDLAGNDLGSSSDGRTTYLSNATLVNSATRTSKIWTQNSSIVANSTIHTPYVGGDIDWTGSNYIYGQTAIKTLTKTGAGDLHMQSSYISVPSFPIDFNINVQNGNLWYDITGSSGLAGVYTLSAGTKLYYASTTQNSTFSGTIAGAGEVVVKTSVTFSGPNTYSGGTTVMNGATLTAGRDVVTSGGTMTSSAIGTGNLTLGDATSGTSGYYNMGGYSTLPNNIVVNGTAGIYSGNVAAVQTISGLISDGSNPGQGLTFYPYSSAKILEITGNNTYTGPTTINTASYTGILVVSHPNALGAISAGTTIGAGGILKLKGDITLNEPITLGGQTTTFGSLSGNNTFTAAYSTAGFGIATISSDTGSTFTFTPSTGNAINLGSTGVTFSGAGTIAVNGPITGAGMLTDSNTGSVTLSGVNTYTGPTYINSGSTLTIGSAGSLGSGAYAGAIYVSGGTLKYASSAVQTLSGVIQGANGGLIVDGNATLTLGGNNTYTGTTTINAGSTLVVGVGASGALPGPATIVDNGTLNFASTTGTTMSGVISGTGLLIKSGINSTITFSGNNTYTGGTLLSGGTFGLGSAGAIGSSGTITFSGGSLQFSASNTTDYSSRFSTADNQLYAINTNAQSVTLGTNLTSLGASFTKLGTGTLTLNGTNTYSGGTTISAGTLKAGSTTALGSGSITVANLGALDLNGQTLTSSGGLTLNGTGASSNTGALLNSSTTAVSYDGLLSLGSASYIMAGTGAINLTNTGTITGATYGLTLDGTAGGSIAGGLGTTTGTLTKSGAGTWTLSGANTYSGNTTINLGTLVIGGSGTLGGGTYAGAITNTGTLNFASSAAQTLSGIISGTAGVLTDSGTGTLTLTGANTYTGVTTINAGSRLEVGSLTNTTAKLGTGAVTDNGNLLFYRSGALSLSGMIATGITGTGNITLQATGAVTVDKTITLSGANSAIYVEAGATSAANTSTVSDVTLSSTITTSSGGTIAIFAGSPTATVTNGSTANLSLKMAGATGAIQYKTYGADLTSLSTLVAGTRNFYYRVSPTGVSASGITATKTYDGSTSALGYTSGGTVSGLSADESGIGAVTSFSFTTANFNDANAGTGKALTLGGASINTATWSIKGLSITTSGGSATINKANLVLSGSKTYDGTSSVAGAQLLATGVNSESFTLTGAGASGNLASANVQTNAGLSSVNGLRLDMSNGTNLGIANNYNSLSVTGSSFSVLPATATLTANKTYDGNASLTASQLTITGVTVGGVTQTLSFSGNANVLDANVATANNYVLASGLSLTNGTGLASNYVLPTDSYGANNRATVNAKPVVVTLTAPSSAYTYDAVTSYVTLASSLTAYTTNASLVGGDSIASLNYAVSGAGVAQAGNFTVTPSLGALSAGAVASNYSFTFNPLTVAVAKASLNVSGTTVVNKTYDQTTQATLSGGTLIGVLRNDSVSLTEAGTFASANVGTNIAVTANDTLSGISASNYTLTQPSGLSGDIAAKALTVSGTTVANKTYNGNNAASISGGTLVGVISGDTVNLTQAGTFASVNAGTGIPVTANHSLGGSSASNYTLTQPTGLSADILKAHLIVTANNASKTYGDTNPALSTTVSGFANGESLATSGVTGSGTATTTATALTGAGTATITAGAGTLTASNYDFTNLVNGTLTIGKAHLTVTANNAIKTYGDANPTLSATVSGFVNGEVLATSGVTGAGAATTAATALTGAGTATITAGAGTLAASNYDFTTFASGTLTIGKANATVTANSSNVTYNGVSQSVSGFTASGLVNGELASVLTGVSISGGTGTNAGTYPLTATGNANNYNLTFVPGNLVIGKANATVTASSSNVTYNGASQSVSGFTASGLVPGETISVLTGVSATGASGTNAGTYASTASGADSNYNLTFVPGSLVIGKASATVTASSGTTTYTGLSQSVSGFTASGLVHGETASVLTGVTAGASGTNAGTYASIASGTDGNYNLTFVNGALTISKAHLTVTANNAIKTYGDASPTLSTTVSGFVNNETLLSANVTGAGAATTAATALTGAGTATITASAGTLAASNYDFNTNLVNGTLTINKANATVTANSSNVTYNGVSQSVSGFTASGLVNGETTAVLTGVSATGATGTNADTYLNTASGTASNYNLTFVPGSLVIGKANATVTASSASTTYTGVSQSMSGFTATGLVHGETASVLTGVTAGASGTNAGTYTSTASGTDRNYNLTFVDGALTINKAHLTVTADNATRVYGDTNPTLSATLSGFVNGESASMSGSGFGTTWSVGVLTNTAGITGAAAVTTAATATTGVGSVPTVAAIGTLAATNYDFTFVNGALAITKAPLSVVLGSQTKVYDGTTNASLTSSNFTLTGFVNGEGAAVTQTQGTYNSANVLNASTVTTNLAAGNFAANAGTSLSNYVLPTTVSSTGTITPASLSATGTKTYDGSVNFDGSALTVAGVHGETFAATGTGTMSSKNVQSNQTLSSIAGLSLTGNGSASTDNYVALSTGDTQVSVTPRAVNLSAPSASKTYDGTTLYQASSSDLATLSNQLVGGDRVTAAEVVYGNKDAGTNKRVTLNTVTISDDNDGRNYTVGKLDVNNGTINKASLTVSVVSDARFVTQTDAAGYAGVVYNGLVGGETAAVLTPGTITRSNSGVGSAGQYNGVLHATNWSSNNYDISYIAGNYTIAGAHTLLVQVPTASTTYGTAATYVPTAKYLDASTNLIVTLTPTVNSNGVWSVNDSVGGQASFSINATGAVLSGAGNVRAGGYNLEAGSLNKTGDNFTNFVLTGGLTVTPKILNNNLGVQAITKVYDGSASISNLGLNFDHTLAGVAANDTVTLLGSGSFDDRHVANNKTVNLSLGLSGADAANYALASPSLSANIGQVTQLASVTYTGATNGNWSDPNNWAGGALPDRNNVAQVVIPTGKTVVYYSDQVGTIGSTLAVNGAVRFSSSNAFTLANTVSGTGNLEQRGTGMLTVSGSNANFSGNLDMDAYSATISNAQALGTGHVVANGGHLSVNAGLTLPSLRVDGSIVLDTAIKTTSDQTYNGALTFLSSGTAQAPNFVSDSGNVSFESTVSAGLGAMTAQRALFVSAPNGTVLFNDQVGRRVQGLDYNTQYLASGALDTSPYALNVAAQTIKLFGDVTTFDSQTYDGAVRVGTNTSNGHTRLLVSMDPTITFKSTVDDADPTGKVNGLDVRAVSLTQIASNAPVPTITFESDVGSVSPLASLRLATGIQNTATGALVTEIKTDDVSRSLPSYKGDIILKGDLTVDDAPVMIAEQLLVPTASQTLTWYNGTPDFKFKLSAPGGSSYIPSNLNQVQWGQTNNGGGNSGGGNSGNVVDTAEAGRQWEMAHRTHEYAAKMATDNAAIEAMISPPSRLVADVQVGNESVLPATPTSHGMYVQVREFAPATLDAQQPFIYQLPADTFVHSREKERIKLSVTTGNGANLPRWVKFSAKDRTLSGKAPKWVKSLDVKVIATDRQGARATTRVQFVFANGSGS